MHINLQFSDNTKFETTEVWNEKYILNVFFISESAGDFKF